MKTLCREKLYAKFKKCRFLLDCANFLRHVVMAQGIEIDLAKGEVVTKRSKPLSVRKICSFLGLANYYRRFNERFSKIASPIT